MKPGQERGAVVVDPLDKELVLTTLSETEGLGPGQAEEIENILHRINNEVLPSEFDPSDGRIILSGLELAITNERFSLGYAGRQQAHDVYEAYRKEALKQDLW